MRIETFTPFFVLFVKLMIFSCGKTELLLSIFCIPSGGKVEADEPEKPILSLPFTSCDFVLQITELHALTLFFFLGLRCSFLFLLSEARKKGATKEGLCPIDRDPFLVENLCDTWVNCCTHFPGPHIFHYLTLPETGIVDSSNAMSALCTLPKDCILRVATFLPLPSMNALRLLSVAWASMMAAQELWEQLFDRDALPLNHVDLLHVASGDGVEHVDATSSGPAGESEFAEDVAAILEELGSCGAILPGEGAAVGSSHPLHKIPWCLLRWEGVYRALLRPERDHAFRVFSRVRPIITFEELEGSLCGRTESCGRSLLLCDPLELEEVKPSGGSRSHCLWSMNNTAALPYCSQSDVFQYVGGPNGARCPERH